MNELDFYRQQSVFTEPGKYAALWDTVNPTIEDMRAAITPLLFHYRGDGDYAENGIAEERVAEVNTRYTTDILDCISAIRPITLGEQRAPHERMVACCRDWALLFVSLARHHGFAARSRVGFANYFADGWWIDHTIGEIWDESAQRWRLVDPELRGAWTTDAGMHVNPDDISRDIFLPGLDAWAGHRAGKYDSATFTVAPNIDVPGLSDVPYLWHNTILDLAALNSYEMILWDVWGMDFDTVNDEGAAVLDEVAASESLEQRQALFARDGLRVPEVITTYAPFEEHKEEQLELRKA